MSDSSPITIPKKEDFLKNRAEALSTDNWKSKYNKNNIEVYIKEVSNSPVIRIKCICRMSDVTARDLYLTLMQEEYVRAYDYQMDEWKIIEEIDQSNDISFYTAKIPAMLKMFLSPRSFLSHRSYGETTSSVEEYMLMMHSHEDSRVPHRKKYVRANIYVTCFLIQADGDSGCKLTYFSQTDLKGNIPKKLMSWSTTKFAPQVMKDFEKQAKQYAAFMKKNPDIKTRTIFPAFMTEDDDQVDSVDDEELD
mmetsp:Transcript_11720/g.17401  ORF Transcript_11720/g.17401 Transcript_11720/m.17401 type:complete len:250 (+) Transcript_11720:44-793(+)